jgi:hypothetical protein
MKKTLLLFILLVVLGGTVIAQEEEAHKNAIYFGTTDILGIAFSYERMLWPNFSLVVESGAGIFVTQSFYATVKARWYPITGTNFGLFVSGGLGYGQLRKEIFYFMWEGNSKYEIYGEVISPGIGIKYGYGKPRGFAFTTAMDYDIVLGEKTRFRDGVKGEPKFGVGLNLNVKMVFGFAF